MTGQNAATESGHTTPAISEILAYGLLPPLLPTLLWLFFDWQASVTTEYVGNNLVGVYVFLFGAACISALAWPGCALVALVTAFTGQSQRSKIIARSFFVGCVLAEVILLSWFTSY